MSIPFFIGLRYTGTSARTQLVSFLARVSILGLVVGVGLLLAVLSIMNGFDRELREKILGLVPQAAIYHHQGIHDWPQLQQKLERNSNIIAAVPFVQITGLIAKGASAEPVMIYGIDPAQESRVSRIQEFVQAEVLQRIHTSSDALVIGSGIAEKLQVNKGDALMLLIPSAETLSTPVVKYFTVVDYVHSGTELDNSIALMNLQSATELNGSPGAVSGLRLKLVDLFSASEVVWDELTELGSGYFGSSWENTHGNLYHAIHLSKKLVALLMFLIVAIAAFNVVSTLIMVVVEKEADIAILRTLGASTRTVMAIFMVLGTAIGLIGTSLGVCFGIAVAAVVEQLVRLVERLFGTHFLNSDVYPLTYLPTQVLREDILLVASVSFIMSFLATLYPAWRASRVFPADALRYE